MKGISTIIVMILLLMISVALTGLGYIFFTRVFTTVTQTSEETISQTVASMLAQMRIESVTPGTPGHIYVRNTGKVNITDFSVYVNDVLESAINAPSEIEPGKVGDIVITNGLSSGEIVKVTTAQGTVAVESVP